MHTTRFTADSKGFQGANNFGWEEAAGKGFRVDFCAKKSATEEPEKKKPEELPAATGEDRLEVLLKASRALYCPSKEGDGLSKLDRRNMLLRAQASLAMGFTVGG
ncbi:hypothetical protein [Candidatus Methylacidithermus pantelleriae]|nr:hypothetical protein [Candidatus Methylacidithermus pantelleriae]